MKLLVTPSFKRNPNLTRQSVPGRSFNGNAEAPKNVSTSNGSNSFDNAFTKDQMLKILSLINDKPSGSANSNMAGMRTQFFNANVYFNLHFQRFFCA